MDFRKTTEAAMLDFLKRNAKRVWSCIGGLALLAAIYGNSLTGLVRWSSLRDRPYVTVETTVHNYHLPPEARQLMEADVDRLVDPQNQPTTNNEDELAARKLQRDTLQEVLRATILTTLNLENPTNHTAKEVELHYETYLNDTVAVEYDDKLILLTGGNLKLGDLPKHKKLTVYIYDRLSFLDNPAISWQGGDTSIDLPDDALGSLRTWLYVGTALILLWVVVNALQMFPFRTDAPSVDASKNDSPEKSLADLFRPEPAEKS